jgi:hypothetical protein
MVAPPDGLRPFLSWLLERHDELGGVTEIRVLGGSRGVWSALATPGDLDEVVEQLVSGEQPHIGEANVYFCMNPVQAERRPRFERVKTTTRDRDIHAYAMFVVDIDPERFPRDQPATEAEKAKAAEVADAVEDWLRSVGAPALRADSGNGYHLLVPMVPAFGDDIEQAARDARTLLRWLDAKFSTEDARIDTSTFNPSRILKLYGTLARKGPNTPDRPYRWANVDLTDIPENVDLFERVAELLETEPPRPKLRSMKRPWDQWRASAVGQLPLEAVYGEWLTGTVRPGWVECRDPDSESGDQRPSAGIADGTGPAERGSFHSFRTGQTESVFDFLIRRGRASNFQHACALVSAWSGVPSPYPNLKVAAAQAPPAQPPPETTPPRTPRGRPVVDYVVNRDTVEDLFVAIASAVKPFARFFRTEREMVFVQRGLGPLPVTDRNIGGLLSALVEIRHLKATPDGTEFVRYAVLASDLARAFVASPRVRLLLPPLTLYTRSPLFDLGWAFIGKAGYHEKSAIYYDGPQVEPREGVERLCEAVADFHWKDEADRVNFVGALLTALTMPHWGRGHPFLAINGNKPGVGKSTLARLLGVVVEGSEPNTVSYAADEAEFEKQLATRIEAGDRVVIIDNAKTQRAIESPVLERCITDTRLNFRRLGSNTAITRPQNDVLFCLTMNLVQLGPDLRRRALPLNLELDANVRQTTYRVGDLVAWVGEHRLELLGELAAMVLAWTAAGKPGCESAARHSTNQPWAETIDAILRLAGFDGFLTNFEASEHAFDPRYELMAEVARDHHQRGMLTSADWVPHLEPLLQDRFQDRHGKVRSARAKATIVGSMFTDYVGTRFDLDDRVVEVTRDKPHGKRKTPAYGFKRVTP